MVNKNDWKDLINQLRFFLFSIIASLIDTLFLVFWVILQWLVDINIISKYQLSGIDSWVLIMFQVLFAIATLVPVSIFYYGDIRVMLIRTKKRIQKESQSPKKNEKNAKNESEEK